MLKEPTLSGMRAVQAYSRKFDQSVYGQISDGMYIRNGNVGYYHINDLDGIYWMLDAHKGFNPKALRMLFRGDQDAVERRFRDAGSWWLGKPVLRYTQALASGIGQCLETAIAVQLVRQRNPMCRERSALVVGYVEYKGWTYHGFNLKLAKHELRILDLSVPDQTAGEEQYEFSLLDVTNATQLDDRRGALFIPKRTDGRRYFLPMEYSRHSPYREREL